MKKPFGARFLLDFLLYVCQWDRYSSIKRIGFATSTASRKSLLYVRSLKHFSVHSTCKRHSDVPSFLVWKRPRDLRRFAVKLIENKDVLSYSDSMAPAKHRRAWKQRLDLLYIECVQDIGEKAAGKLFAAYAPARSGGAPNPGMGLPDQLKAAATQTTTSRPKYAKLVGELSESELEERREKERTKKAKLRRKQSGKTKRQQLNLLRGCPLVDSRHIFMLYRTGAI